MPLNYTSRLIFLSQFLPAILPLLGREGLLPLLVQYPVGFRLISCKNCS